jgi:membrane protease YdiL (CAAX protease family)
MSPEISPSVAATPPAASSRVYSANLLFLTCLALTVLLGGIARVWHPLSSINSGTSIILGEAVCFLLPACLFALRSGSPAAALRLKWPGAGPSLLGLFAGAAVVPLLRVAERAAAQILGYEFQMAGGQPASATAVLALVVGSAIAAPICEEVVFRGYILTAYEAAGIRPWTAILTITAMFIGQHVSPARATAVGIHALMLTWLAWRTRSIWPAVAGHLGANGVAMLIGPPQTAAAARGLDLAAIPGTALAACCLWMVARSGAVFACQPVGRRTRLPHSSWWPLWLAGLLVGGLASADVVQHRHLSAPAVSGLPLEAPWTAPLHLRYGIQGPSGNIGEADYHLAAQAPAGWRLHGWVEFRAANGMSETPIEMSFDASWSPASLRLYRFSGTVTRAGQKGVFCPREEKPSDRQPALDGGFFSPYELPWRLSAAEPLPRRAAGPLATLDLWESPIEGRGTERLVTVFLEQGEEAVRVPAGEFRTVRVTLGTGASVWYEVNKPFLLIQYRTADVVWMLASCQ